MDLTSLACFTSAADTLHFRSAARRVALSPAAFSDRIRRLEDELGVALFVRTTRSSALTDAGRRLLPHARKLLADAAQCRDIALADDRLVPFEITLGTRFELGMSWLLPALTALEAQHPERTVHVSMGDTPDLTRRLDRGEIDAFVSSARLTAPHLEMLPLHEEAYTFVGTSPDVRGAEDVRTQTLVDISPDLPLFRYLLDALPDGATWRFARHSFMGSLAGIRHRVLAGKGLAVLPTYFVRPDLDAGRLVQLLPEVAIRSDTFRLVWRQRHPLDAALRDLGDALRAHPLC